MPNKTCPLCGGKLKNNYCESCGYDVPNDDEGLSAIYDMDPENDAFGEVVREITPEVQSEEIYPNRPAGFDTAYEQPKFKVRDNEGKTVHQNYRNQSPPPPPFAGQNAGNGGAYGAPPNTGAQNNGGNYVPPPSPFANQGNGSGQSKQYATAGDFVKDYWWMLLLSFLAPIVGIILLVTIGKQIDQKYRGIVIAAIVLGFILPP
ncbi:MAG: hypothetical protein K2N60_05755 [Oscillospiraceae bacterium]|nr:hypothetical protein [Oscillospiraceae bacterium]